MSTSTRSRILESKHTMRTSLDSNEEVFVEEKMEVGDEKGEKEGKQESKEDINIICWSESLIRTRLREMEVNESMLQDCVMIPATIDDDAPSMRINHLNEFIDTVKDNNSQNLEWENMDKKQKLEGITLIYDKYWKQTAIDTMKKH